MGELIEKELMSKDNVFGIGCGIYIVNKGIELAKDTKDNKYFINVGKMHNLLFLADCYFLSQTEDWRIFNEEVILFYDGPFIAGISVIAAECGFGTITERIELKDQRFIAHMLGKFKYREKALDMIMQYYGNMDELKLQSKTYEACEKTIPLIQYKKLDGSYVISDKYKRECWKLMGNKELDSVSIF